MESLRPELGARGRETRRGWRACARGARAAVVFLTRLRVGGFPYSPAEWSWAVAHFPLVGAGIGSVSAVVWVMAERALGAGPAALLALAASLGLTGAFHEDGLADSADALGGFARGEAMMRIFKDSRLGTYGVTALVLALGLRASALWELTSASWPVLVWAHCWARVAPVWQMVCLPYLSPGDGSKSRDLQGAGPRQAVVATGWGLFGGAGAWAAGVSPLTLGAGALFLVTLGIALGTWYRARVGGVVGDLLGATEQLAEVGLLLLALLVLRTT